MGCNKLIVLCIISIFLIANASGNRILKSQSKSKSRSKWSRSSDGSESTSHSSVLTALPPSRKTRAPRSIPTKRFRTRERTPATALVITKPERAVNKEEEPAVSTVVDTPSPITPDVQADAPVLITKNPSDKVAKITQDQDDKTSSSSATVVVIVSLVGMVLLAVGSIVYRRYQLKKAMRALLGI